MKLFDYYSFRARLQPALFTAIPLALGVFAWTPPGTGWVSALWSLIVAGGGTFFLASEIRNAGKQIEARLWDSWGGIPTSQLLSRRGPANPELREHWQVLLEKLFSKPLSTVQEELTNPKQAEERYAAAVQLLIAKTRNTKEFPLIYAENINYGFCRNLYGVKKLGIALCILGLISSVTSSLHNAWLSRVDYLPLGCLAMCIFLMYKWLFTVNSEWVRVPAFAYAHRLLESLEQLSSVKSAPGKRKKADKTKGRDNP